MNVKMGAWSSGLGRQPVTLETFRGFESRCPRIEEDMKKIYESPDKGKTIYERNFGDYDSRKLIRKDGKWLSGNTNQKSK